MSKATKKLPRQHLQEGDKVVKFSGKPFKSGAKIGTIESFTTNPNSQQPAAVMKEDGSIVDLYQIDLLKDTNAKA